MVAGEGACASSGSSELSAFRVGRCWGVPTPAALTGCAGAAQLAPPRRGRSPAAPAAATWEGQYPQTLRKTAQYEARVLPRAGRCSLRLLFRQRCRTTPWPYGRWIRNAALWRAEQSSVLVWVPVAEHTVSGHLLTQAGGWHFRPLGGPRGTLLPGFGKPGIVLCSAESPPLLRSLADFGCDCGGRSSGSPASSPRA